MKNLIRTFTTLLVVVLFAGSLAAQNYCIPPGFLNIGGAGEPFTFISLVKLQNLNNATGMPTGNGDDNGYTYYSELAVPVLLPGETYHLEIGGSDNLGNGMEIRVWIDWDGNGEFDAVNELAGMWGTSGLQYVDMVVPMSAKNGITRMRVYCDMPFTMGHIYPEPCGYLYYPGHGIGQHGEVEDYDVQIGHPTGVDHVLNKENFTLFPTPAKDHITIQHAVGKNFAIYDMIGKEIISGQISDANEIIDVSSLKSGQYIFVNWGEHGRKQQQFQVSQ